jgi:cytochrome c peroxidase
MFNQQIHGSKRSLRSIEDFTEFEQRTAYFDGDHVTAAKKGVNLPDRASQVAMMAQMQNMFDFPPAPKLNALGKLDPDMATKEEMKGQEVFFGKGRCAVCHPAPFYLDDKMHDLRLERFYEPEMINNHCGMPDGSLDENDNGMAMAGRVAKGADKGCIACHAKAKGDDYVFTNDM